jgi:hypothetical protein
MVRRDAGFESVGERVPLVIAVAAATYRDRADDEQRSHERRQEGMQHHRDILANCTPLACAFLARAAPNRRR